MQIGIGTGFYIDFQDVDGVLEVYDSVLGQVADSFHLGPQEFALHIVLQHGDGVLEVQRLILVGVTQHEGDGLDLTAVDAFSVLIAVGSETAFGESAAGAGLGSLAGGGVPLVTQGLALGLTANRAGRLSNTVAANPSVGGMLGSIGFGKITIITANIDYIPLFFCTYIFFSIFRIPL